ncbi:MAG: ribose transport system ATP-binding protein [Candidatus Petromonas sp.]|uniref:ABC-type sugar transport system, ATPase component n=1 Tax=Thermoanaerobacter thermohydrosulfuricus WC1 TaxID=1198630 RepID=M8CXR1_THETY|nr:MULTISPECIES: sugar ABC transporter ATP-binding protein [Thermoanaerobacter]ABY92290.1 ABC transporter related [Thermoanaerobacter sp. X514]EMT39154.1 ABC-type sugar transport system, ATPase component [Thermoanaerobacter thermohydrosulfuricus WC1]MDK2920343.1 ribose transport system ATP-binding protein [Candidatus Petromonas sp.]
MNEQYILELEGIHKSFNGVKVLENVNFKVKAGEVHALVGGNGAGKSTLMKILTGVYKCDKGVIKINGKVIKIEDPNDAKKYGIRMIFQELSLVPTLTVAENIFLTNEPITKGFAINKRIIQEKTSKLLKEFDIDVDPNARVSSLGVGYCQLIEIAKSLATEANILIMDEPTASLSEAETNILFNFIKKLKEKGVSIIYISHRMNEIFKVADRITILRDGKNVITTEIDKINIQEIIEYMMGSKVEKIFEWQERDQMIDNDYILEVKELTVNSQIKDISFKLKKGEILGIAGLMGSGRTEILEAIFGIREKIKGEILIEGKRTEIKSVKDAISAGIALVPENRREQGLVLMHSVKENIILPNLQRLLHVFAINTKKVKMLVETSIKEFSIKTDSINKPVRFLSGGNQQKVVIAKWLKTNPKVLLLDEPTAGVDVGAKGEIVNIIREFANSGKGVIVVSSELAELLAVCDRILILSKGRIINEYLRKDIESEEVLQHAIQQ